MFLLKKDGPSGPSEFSWSYEKYLVRILDRDLAFERAEKKREIA